MFSQTLFVMAAMVVALAHSAVFDGSQFAIVADVGSGGTRFTLFDLSGNKKAKTEDISYITCNAGQKNDLGSALWKDSASGTMGMEEYWTNNLKVLLGDTACSYNSVTASTLQMLIASTSAINIKGKEYSVGNIATAPADWLVEFKKMKFLLRATAGMRSDGANVGKFAKLEQVAHTQGWPLVSCQIIGGNVEGAFGFMANAANFVNAASSETKDNTVFVEVGGASGQVAFSCPASYCSGAGTTGTAQSARRLLSMLGRQDPLRPSSSLMEKKEKGYVQTDANTCVFAESFMGYGADELLAQVILQGGTDALGCLVDGVTLTESATGTFSVKPTATSAMDKSKAALCRELETVAKFGSTQLHLTGYNTASPAPVTVTGTGVVADCKKALLAISYSSGTPATAVEARGDATPKTFQTRWETIKTAFTACTTGAGALAKTNIQMKNAVPFTYDTADTTNANWVKDDWMSQAVFASDTAGKPQFAVYNPMHIAQAQMFKAILDEFSGLDLPLHVLNVAARGDWDAFLSQNLAKSLSFVSTTPPMGQSAGAFMFTTDAHGPQEAPNEPEMWTLKLA